jgi:diacylglycerol kinase family enzyme
MFNLPTVAIAINKKREEETEFAFIEFNHVRYSRGANAARVAVIQDGEKDLLWMSKKDIEKNMGTYGKHPELLKAHASYP